MEKETEVQLESSRFILRKIQPQDIETLFGYWSDAAVTEYMSATFSHLQEAEEMATLLNNLSETGQGYRWSVVDKARQKVLGTCGFHNVKPEHRRAEIGYELGREFWSQGIMQEVLKVVIDYCFGRLNFNRLEAFVTQGNSRSLNTLLSLGFQVEGALRNYEYVRGEFQDQIILALLKREWESKSDSGVRQSLG